jgi:hypothetical protein
MGLYHEWASGRANARRTVPGLDRSAHALEPFAERPSPLALVSPLGRPSASREAPRLAGPTRLPTAAQGGAARIAGALDQTGLVARTRLRLRQRRTSAFDVLQANEIFRLSGEQTRGLFTVQRRADRTQIVSAETFQVDRTARHAEAAIRVNLGIGQ